MVPCRVGFARAFARSVLDDQQQNRVGTRFICVAGTGEGCWTRPIHGGRGSCQTRVRPAGHPETQVNAFAESPRFRGISCSHAHANHSFTRILEGRYESLVPGPGPKDRCNHLELAGSSARSVQRFLYQNGFKSIHEVDGSGWAPVHYAAMRGDSDVIHGLLEMCANIDRWTKTDQPQSGILLGTTPLQICRFFRHYSDTILCHALANLC